METKKIKTKTKSGKKNKTKQKRSTIVFFQIFFWKNSYAFPISESTVVYSRKHMLCLSQKHMLCFFIFRKHNCVSRGSTHCVFALFGEAQLLFSKREITILLLVEKHSFLKKTQFYQTKTWENQAKTENPKNPKTRVEKTKFPRVRLAQHFTCS